MHSSRPVLFAAALLICAAPVFFLPSSVSAERQTRTAPAAQPIRGDIEHGRYLAERVAMCIECHSTRDAQGNIIPGEEYMGGSIPFRPPWPNDWAMRAPRNRGLPGYSDEAAMRLLTHGAIDRNGIPLRRPMPRFFMSEQDAADVIAYLRSLP